MRRPRRLWRSQKPYGKLERSAIDPAVMSAFELETSTHEKTKKTLAKSNRVWETGAYGHGPNSD